MKKALDQTVRELKREVNKKVLKVPSIEQKTLDATSNEPWAPRGSLMAEIAQASCNYNDYQLVMPVLWKRIQDTGKNWRHVYKALNVLEYLLIYGSERVIDDIREHAYQISTLSDFLYTDSNGRDQGSNVRRKSQTLVTLVNDKKRLKEVRDRALSNKVSLPPLSSSARYNDEHFEGAKKEDGYRSGGGKYSQFRNQSVKNNDELYSRHDNYKVHSNGDFQNRPRSQSVDVDTNNSFDDYDHHSTRIDAPPSYEVSTKDSWSDVQNDKDRGPVMASMQKGSSPSGPEETSFRGTNLAPGSVAGESAHEFDPPESVTVVPTVASRGLELDIFGLSAVDYTDSSASMLINSTAIPHDMLTSSAHAVPSEPDHNPFGDAPFKAIPQEDFPSQTNTSASATSQACSNFVTAAEINLPVEKKMETPQSYDFGNAPNFAPDISIVQHSLANSDYHASEFPAANSTKDILDGILPWTGPAASISFQETQPSDQSHFLSLQGFSSYSASQAHSFPETGSADLQMGQVNPFEQPQSSNPFENPAFNPSPPTEITENQMNSSAENSVLSHPQTLQGFQPASLNNFQPSHMISMDKQGLSYTQQQNLSFQPTPLSSQINNLNLNHVESAQLNLLQKPMELSLGLPIPSQINIQPFRPAAAASVRFHEAQLALKNTPVSSQAAQQATSIMPSFTPNSSPQDLTTCSQEFTMPQPSSKKFEPKSAIWADTISRGLVNLNISGSRTNPLADIGVDFDDINRKEKRNEAKSSQSSSPSSFAMGRPMGIGSGLGRAGTSMFTQPPIGTGQPYIGLGMGASPGMMHPSYNPMNARGGYDGQHQPYGHGGYNS